MYLASRGFSQPALGRKDRRQMLEALIHARHAVSGVLANCMSHDVAYQFLGLGEHIERADMTTRILDIHSAILMPNQGTTRAELGLIWVGVLNTLSGLQMYRRHAGCAGKGDGGITGEGALRYLIGDPHFPRSVVYCLDAIETSLAELPRNTDPLRALRPARRRTDRVAGDDLGSLDQHEFLDAVQGDLAHIHDAIAREYFHLHQQTGQSGAVA
jgi:uncharacterized alpha-E superfamily protein